MVHSSEHELREGSVALPLRHLADECGIELHIELVIYELVDGEEVAPLRMGYRSKDRGSTPEHVEHVQVQALVGSDVGGAPSLELVSIL
ncbi:unnamed protein product [Linum trigynum]|uniref:Uncharacterized protein n=1 Tax=Linum trigynum TaxID=586398 RepID=A0AAV2E830_9ROSI